MDPQQLFARLRAATAALSGRQLVTLAVAFVSVVGLTIASAYWLNRPRYEVLFSDMDPESAGTVVERLKAAKVDYVVDDGGRTVKVPASRIDEMRLQVASQGMPASGRVGFELLDRTSFGTTDFMERVNYRRALEGELGRTIATLSEVAGARVHIAMPQPALFTGSDRPTTASVVLKLRNNRQLDPATVNAITGLVAASVESLRPESVVVIDNFGHPLARPASESDAMGGGAALEQQRRIEQDLSTKLVRLIEPIVGMGRARVNVNAIINTASQEQTEERWDPASPVIRNQQTLTQSSGSLNAAGMVPTVAGARANMPTTPPAGSGATAAPPPPAVALGPGGTTSSSQTTNFEVSKTVVRTVQPRGQVARLSVAVLLDDAHAPPAPGTTGSGTSTPRTAEELNRIRGLVAATVGFDEGRGDRLTVENVAFEEAPALDVEEPTFVERYREQGFEVLRVVGTLVVALLAMLFIIRPIVRGVLPAKAPVPLGAGAATMQAKTVQEIEAEIDAQIEASLGSSVSKRLPALTRKATALTEKEPENAARLLRAWLTEEER